jgi:hypothetical protein
MLPLTIYSLGLGPGLVMLRLRLQEHIVFLVDVGMLWLGGSLGFERRVAYSRVINVLLRVGALEKLPCPATRRGGRAVPRLYNYTLAFTFQLRKNHGKMLVRVVETTRVNNAFQLFLGRC